MTFIHDKSYSELTKLLIILAILLQPACDKYLKLLSGCNYHLASSVSKTLKELPDIFRIIDIYGIVSGIGLECHRRLCIQVLAVNQENGFLNRRNIHQEVSACLVGCHSFARAGCMPYIAGYALLGCLTHGTDGVDLVGSKDKQLPLVIIQYGIFCHHLVSLRNAQNRLGKIYIIANRMISFVNPASDEFLIQLRVPCRRKIFGICGIADHKHLYI